MTIGLRAPLKAAAGWGAAGYYGVALWPGGYAAVESGLDPSWMYAINLLFQMGPVFGREVAFTYGPLGFLLYPRATGGNLETALAFWAIVHLATVALLAQAAWLGRHWQVCGLVAAAAAGQAIGVWPEYWAALNAGLFAWSSLLLPGRAWPWALAAGALCGAIAAMKLTSGAAAVSIAVLAFLLAPAAAARRKQAALLAVAAFAAVWLPLLFRFFDGAGAAVQWLLWSFEISSGYGAAMSLVVRPESLWNALLAALAYLAFAAAGGSRLRRLAWTLAFFLFIAFRHGYVRQGGHSMAFYGAACAAPALLLFFAETRRERAAAALVAVAASGVALYHSARFPAEPAFDPARMADLFSLRRGIRRLNDHLRVEEIAARLEAVARGMASRDVPPNNWPQIMRSEYGRVASVPWEITSLVNAGLPWQPLPSLQLYSAYTRRLDLATADVFRGSRRPHWIWMMNIEIDGRRLLTDNPETWLAILDNYEAAAVDRSLNQLLLRARARPAVTVTEAAARVETATEGEWIETPAPGRLWRACLEIRPTLWGRLAAVCYQWPPVMADVVREDGSAITLRILPDTARGGLLMPLFPESAEEFASVLENRPRNLARRFRLRFPAGNYFHPRFDVRWAPASRRFAPAAGTP